MIKIPGDHEARVQMLQPDDVHGAEDVLHHGAGVCVRRVVHQAYRNVTKTVSAFGVNAL